MNCPTLFLSAATAALAVSLVGCAEAQPRYHSYAPRSTSPPPQSYGTASVRFVQPAAAPEPAPVPTSRPQRQPHMQRALANLENARAQLSAARAHGGHSQNALNAVDEAIGHVRSGINYDNSH